MSSLSRPGTRCTEMPRRQLHLFAWSFLLASSVSAQSATPPPDLAEAQRSFAAKHYQESAALAAFIAEHTLDRTLRLAALMLEAKSRINLNQFSAAETVLDRYLSSKMESAEALYLLGYVLERENKARESLAIYTRAAALAPPQPNDLKLVALDYVLLNDSREAIRWLKRSLAEDPSSAEAWYFLGRAQMQNGDFVEAEKDLRQALALAPGDPKALDNLGLSLEAQNRTEEAARAYAEAIASQKGTPKESEQPLLNLGTLLNNENRASEALPYLQHAVELAPNSVRAQEELSRSFGATGERAQGIRAMERAVALDAANPRLHFLLGQLYRKAGETAKAKAEIETSTRLYGRHATEQE